MDRPLGLQEVEAPRISRQSANEGGKSMWSKKPTSCHLVLYLFLLYKLLNMFRATLCPSSGADDLVVFFHVWCSAVAV